MEAARPSIRWFQTTNLQGARNQKTRTPI